MLNSTVNLDKRWESFLDKFTKKYGLDEANIQGILFLIGVNELGYGPKKFSKQEKLDLIHIGLCEILSKTGIYKKAGYDSDGWPTYEKISSLKISRDNEEDYLKREIMRYFNNINI